jgi:hypothetical protein
MSAIAAPIKEVPKGFVWRRLHSQSDALRGYTRPEKPVVLDASVLQAASLPPRIWREFDASAVDSAQIVRIGAPA